MKQNLIASFFVALLAGAIVWSVWSGAASIAPLAPVLAGLPSPEEVPTPTKAYARALEVELQANRLLRSCDKAGLEALGESLRKSGERADGGTWLLSLFYRGASQLPEAEPAATSAMQFYSNWAKESPDDVTAQVCYARALTSHAWLARGTGFADTVTEEGWRLFRERLEKANSVLERARRRLDYCPGLFEAQQTVALGQGWPREVYMSRFVEAIERQPSYGGYYTNICRWLFARWYGQPGDYEHLIQAVANAMPADERDRQYAFLVWMGSLASTRSEDFVFAPKRLDWERTKRGFKSWLRNDPDNLVVRDKFLLMALLADDRETAREQFQLTGGRYLPRCWKDRQEVEEAIRFAFQNGPNPMANR